MQFLRLGDILNVAGMGLLQNRQVIIADELDQIRSGVRSRSIITDGAGRVQQVRRRAFRLVRLENRLEDFPKDVLAFCEGDFEGRARDDGGRSGGPVEVDGADEDQCAGDGEDGPQPAGSEDWHGRRRLSRLVSFSARGLCWPTVDSAVSDEMQFDVELNADNHASD